MATEMHREVTLDHTAKAVRVRDVSSDPNDPHAYRNVAHIPFAAILKDSLTIVPSDTPDGLDRVNITVWADRTETTGKVDR